MDSGRSFWSIVIEAPIVFAIGMFLFTGFIFFIVWPSDAPSDPTMLEQQKWVLGFAPFFAAGLGFSAGWGGAVYSNTTGFLKRIVLLTIGGFLCGIFLFLTLFVGISVADAVSPAAAAFDGGRAADTDSISVFYFLLGISYGVVVLSFFAAPIQLAMFGWPR